jgi:hypothetical protein
VSESNNRSVCLPMQSRTSSLSVSIACVDIRDTISESSTREVTYSLHSVYVNVCTSLWLQSKLKMNKRRGERIPSVRDLVCEGCLSQEF